MNLDSQVPGSCSQPPTELPFGSWAAPSWSPHARGWWSAPNLSRMTGAGWGRRGMKPTTEEKPTFSMVKVTRHRWVSGVSEGPWPCGSSGSCSGQGHAVLTSPTSGDPWPRRLDPSTQPGTTGHQCWAVGCVLCRLCSLWQGRGTRGRGGLMGCLFFPSWLTPALLHSAFGPGGWPPWAASTGSLDQRARCLSRWLPPQRHFFGTSWPPRHLRPGHHVSLRLPYPHPHHRKQSCY